ncbi:hypothetical protein N7463_007895 [Penicillium fimorum]|uniref:Uncharacterized protein n=1 Tax=Penicillium fimorum TaxID=1882269 RepID=A0A9W9XYH4_9EURO|nr:hypothetical protein N7463_007895 [Penicillium fimorum]
MLMQRMGKMTTFSYQYRESLDTYITQALTVKAFIKVLYAHKKSLEILDVDTESRIYIFEIDDEEERDIQFKGISDDITTFYKLIWTYGVSLEEFVALKRLSLEINFLLYFAAGVSGKEYKTGKKLELVEYLPAGLEYLCVRGYHKGGRADGSFDAILQVRVF